MYFKLQIYELFYYLQLYTAEFLSVFGYYAKRNKFFTIFADCFFQFAYMIKQIKDTAVLLLHCPDKQGIIANVTEFINVNKGNIIYLDQHTDTVQKVFFMRIEWELDEFLIPKDKVEEYFSTLIAQKYSMEFQIYFHSQKPRMALFVSKSAHCMYDLLAHYEAGDWNVEIPLIISNHPDLEHIANKFGIPFHCFPITKENKAEMEAKEMQLLADNGITFCVLARYMQIISPLHIE